MCGYCHLVSGVNEFRIDANLTKYGSFSSISATWLANPTKTIDFADTLSISSGAVDLL